MLCQWKICKLSLHYLAMMRCLVLLCVTTVLALRSESFGAVNHESVNEAHKAANEHKAEGSGGPEWCEGLQNKNDESCFQKIQREGLQRSVKLHVVQTSMEWWLQQTPVMRVKNGQDVSKHALHAPCDANHSLVCVQVAEACCHPAALLDSRPFGVGSKKRTPASLRKLSKLKSLRLSPRS